MNVFLISCINSAMKTYYMYLKGIIFVFTDLYIIMQKIVASIKIRAGWFSKMFINRTVTFFYIVCVEHSIRKWILYGATRTNVHKYMYVVNLCACVCVYVYIYIAYIHTYRTMCGKYKICLTCHYTFRKYCFTVV